METEFSPNKETLSELGQKEKIQILLAEYATLRTEITGRIGYGFQIGGISAAIITWLLQQALTNSSVLLLLGSVILLLGVLGFSWINVRDLFRNARRVREIEFEINSRAGEYLLLWEMLWGGGRI